MNQFRRYADPHVRIWSVTHSTEQRKSHAVCTSLLKRADCRTPVQGLCISIWGVTLRTSVTNRSHVTNQIAITRQYAGPDSVQCLSVRK